MRPTLVAGTLLVACSATGAGPVVAGPSPSLEPQPGVRFSSASSEPKRLTASELLVPGVGPYSFGHVACERERRRVWVPAGSTGRVEVLDIATGTFTPISGFGRTTHHGGPSAAALGDGFAFVLNGGTGEVCPVSITTLKRGKCLGIGWLEEGAFVASAHELWITQRAPQLIILDAVRPEALAVKALVALPSTPRGVVVDQAHGIFFTNLENGSTVATNVASRHLTASFRSTCETDGLRGLAFDAARNILFVACADHVEARDPAHDGAMLDRLETGAGVDGIDYLASKKLLYVAAGESGRLTVARVGDGGRFGVYATADTAPGAVNAVADREGNAYVADPLRARLLVVAAE